MKTEIRDLQPIAYQTLTRALKQDHLAHAYLFHGPKGTLKKEMALFLAKSLNCQETEACEVCETCRRIEAGQHSDVLSLSGEAVSIKKEDMMKLQHELNKTALEKNGRKVYIIERMENATAEAQNALLKFLEEPANDRLAILLVEQLDRVLPTIVSRCQIITFHPLSKISCYRKCLELGMDDLDAYLLSELNRSAQACMNEAQSEYYQNARSCFQKTIDVLFDGIDDAVLILQLEGFCKKQKEEKKWLHALLQFYRILFEDSMKAQCACQDPWYQKQLALIAQKRFDRSALLTILLESDDLLLRSVNVAMLIDQLMYRIKEVLSHE